MTVVFLLVTKQARPRQLLRLRPARHGVLPKGDECLALDGREAGDPGLDSLRKHICGAPADTGAALSAGRHGHTWLVWVAQEGAQREPLGVGSKDGRSHRRGGPQGPSEPQLPLRTLAGLLGTWRAGTGGGMGDTSGLEAGGKAQPCLLLSDVRQQESKGF